MYLDTKDPRARIFICTKSDCKKRGSKKIAKAFKKAAKECGLKKRIAVVPCGCLDQCSKGPNVVVIPGGQMYHDVAAGDAEELFRAALADSKPAKAEA